MIPQLTKPNLWLPEPKVLAPARLAPSWVRGDWRFGLGVGAKLFDYSRYRSHGTIVGAQWATGAHGYALDFIPTTPSYVEIPAAHTQLDFTSENFAIILRVKFDSLLSYPRLVARGRYAVDGWLLFWSVGAGLVLSTCQSGKSQDSLSGTSGWATGVWYTVGITRNGAAAQLYRNGVDVTSVAGTHKDPTTAARSALVGIDYDKTTYPVDGKIEFLRVIGGYALSASEHLAWHNALA